MSVVALSTMWMSPLGYDPALRPEEAGGQIIARAELVGAQALELDYRLRDDVLKILAKQLRSAGLKVTSLHAPLPIPEGLTQPTAEPFNPASTDAEERTQAVKHIATTLQWAHELEAQIVVVHLGSIPALADGQLTKASARGEPEAREELQRLLEKRRELAPVHLDMASFSLEKLARRAEELGVVLGLENRYHFFEIPSLEELELLLKRFEGAPVGPWYDVGHGYTQALAGIRPWPQWLERLGKQLVGCHIHDAIGPQDHRPPPAGEVPWEELGQWLGPVQLKVVEVTSEHDPEQVAQALDFARQLCPQPKEETA